MRLTPLFLLLACTGPTGPATPTEADADTDTDSDTDTDTDADVDTDPPGDGVIVLRMSVGSESATIDCPAGDPYGLVSLPLETVNFNTLNHSDCVTTGPWSMGALLNVPLVDSTDLPTAEGSTPVDVTFEVVGVQNRRSIHDALTQAWTVHSWGDGSLDAELHATWADASLDVWFLDAPVVER